MEMVIVWSYAYLSAITGLIGSPSNLVAPYAVIGVRRFGWRQFKPPTSCCELPPKCVETLAAAQYTWFDKYSRRGANSFNHLDAPAPVLIRAGVPIMQK